MMKIKISWVYLFGILCGVGSTYYNFIFAPQTQNLTFVFIIWALALFLASWFSLTVKIGDINKWLILGIMLLFYCSLFIGFEVLNYYFYHTLILPNQIFSWLSAPILGIAVANFIGASLIEKYNEVLTVIIVFVMAGVLGYIYYVIPFYITLPVAIILFLISLIMVKRNVQT